MWIEIKINGIELKDQKCFSCGKKFSMDDQFIVSIDKGTPESQLEPENPPVIYLTCVSCFEELNKLAAAL